MNGGITQFLISIFNFFVLSLFPKKKCVEAKPLPREAWQFSSTSRKLLHQNKSYQYGLQNVKTTYH